MASAAERMKRVCERRREEGLRELRLVLPDARSEKIRREIAEQAARLDPDGEREIMDWIEAVSEFEEDAPR